VALQEALDRLHQEKEALTEQYQAQVGALFSSPECPERMLRIVFPLVKVSWLLANTLLIRSLSLARSWFKTNGMGKKPFTQI
jgi:hypothetical protein